MSFAEIHRHLRACCLILGKNIFLIVWFEKKLEDIVNDLWLLSPSQALDLHERMVRDIESHVQLFLPEVSSYGCAPVPHPKSELNEALEDIGLHLHLTGQLNRVYATITCWPWQDGCTCCALNQTCPGPKRKNQTLLDFLSLK